MHYLVNKMLEYLCFYITTVCCVVAEESSLPALESHTCVIGAGYSGLASARYLKQYGVNFTVYEAAKDIGGTWRFDPLVGTDEYGVPMFTSQYKHLRIFTPRQTMEFNGFKFPEGTPSYPSGNCFFRYMKSFAREFDLMKFVKLHSYVTSVKLEDGYWSLTYTDAKSKTIHTERCDFVVVANGQYELPNMPTFHGLADFRGIILHSRDYKDANEFRGRNVLLVGAGASGLDLSMQLVNITAKLVHSHHLVYNQPDYPDSYIKKPDIQRFKLNGVLFEDGSFEEVDTVIFCTGYQLIQPFIHKHIEERTFVPSLHKFIVNIQHPTLVFVGAVKRVITRALDAQAQYVAFLIAGKFQLPSKDEMLKISNSNIFRLDLDKRTMSIVYDQSFIIDTNKYFAHLTEEAGIDKVPPVINKMQELNVLSRLQDVLNYRDYDYQVIDDNNFMRWYNPRNMTCAIEE